MPDLPLDPWQDLFAVQLAPERLRDDLAAFADVLRELRLLRELDLTDVHPAVIFEPTAPYRRGSGSP